VGASRQPGDQKPAQGRQCRTTSASGSLPFRSGASDADNGCGGPTVPDNERVRFASGASDADDGCGGPAVPDNERVRFASGASDADDGCGGPAVPDNERVRFASGASDAGDGCGGPADTWRFFSADDHWLPRQGNTSFRHNAVFQDCLAGKPNF
jgi:hypothetical protein